jgi:nucleotide-binding universal stress UspA family protein
VRPHVIEHLTPAATRTLLLRDGVLGIRFEVAGDIIEGHPKQVLLDEAEKWGADLIVVGSHGRRGLDRFLLGSVSQAVALHARCSVEIVRVPKRPPAAEKPAA